MKLKALASVIKIKYAAKSDSELSDIVKTLKYNIVNGYNLYVNPQKAKQPIFGYLVQQINEPMSKAIISVYTDVVDNIDTYSLDKIYNRLNKIQAAITEFDTDEEKRLKIRGYIHDSMPWKTQADKNKREFTKQQFSKHLSRVSSTLAEVLPILQKMILTEVPVAGDRVDSQRKELPKQRLLNFIYSPEAQELGLDDLDMMEKIIDYPDLKQQLTTIINAIDRGRVSKQMPDFSKEVAELIKAYNMKKENDNSGLFEEEI